MAGAGRKALADLRDGNTPADQAPVPGLVAERHLPADGPDVARELPDARLARVVADDLLQCTAAEPERRGTQAGRHVLRRDQVRCSDGDLLGLGVAGSSMGSRRSRNAGGIRFQSFAVVMKKTAERSNGSSRNASRKRPCWAGSSTSNRTAAGLNPILSISSSTNTGSR